MSDDGLAVAAKKYRRELVAADACLTKEERIAASRRREGAYSHPARPGRYVHDLNQPLRPGRTISAKTEITLLRTRREGGSGHSVVGDACAVAQAVGHA